MSQNRQFQWFSHPTVIYPVVPASAATLLHRHGHEILWHDGIVRAMDPDTYRAELIAWQPDLLFIETKTPVVEFHWQWIREIKKVLPTCKVVLAGDHVTALPEESLREAPVDHVLKGGDYDLELFTLLTGQQLDFQSLPRINRTLTRWRDYAFRNGNFARTPGAYMMAGRDCWHGACTFCSWTTLYPHFRVRAVEDVLDEVGELISLGVREIMDDTGSFPVGPWLQRFCEGMIARGYHRKVRLNCNLRFGAVDAPIYQRMRRAGFRLVLFGVESANQETLDRLNKRLTLEQIRTGAQAASRAGLEVHITCMFGYPWESMDAAKRTADFARELLRKGYARTLQATWLVPYPGTPLFKELQTSRQLLTERWSDYDMRSPVMQCPLSEAQIKALIAYTYRGHLHPRVILRHGFTSLTHPTTLFRGLFALLGHLRDFRSSGDSSCTNSSSPRH